MKKPLLSILMLFIITTASFSQKLSGEYSNDGKSTGSYYTKIKWEVSYNFEEKNGNFYIKFYDPKISVPNYSLYHDEFKKEYSLADLGLASWPNSRQLPFAMSVKVNISDGYNNYESTASCNADFTCGDTYIASKANLKNVTLQNFRVTGVTYFRANLGGEPAVDDILKSRRQSAGKSSATSNVPANTASANVAVSSANTSGNNPLANSTPATTYGGATQTEVYVKAAATVVGNLVDEMNANYEKKQARWKAESDANTKALLLKEEKKKQAKFVSEYVPLMEQAKNGDENARMTLYFASYNLWATEYVPQRERWLGIALANYNTDALLEKARLLSGEIGKSDYDFNKGMPYLEKAAALGSADAMLILGNWYNTKNISKYGVSFVGGENEQKALEWYNKAAEAGSPNAMYYLGMIYTYGSISSPHIKVTLKYKVVKDEKVALEWFIKAEQPQYKESLYARSVSSSYKLSSYEPRAYYEIFLLYKKGKIVRNKVKAAEMEAKIKNFKKGIKSKEDLDYEKENEKFGNTDRY